MATAAGGTQLSRGMKVFLGVDVVLVAIFLVVLVMVVGGSGGSEDAGRADAQDVSVPSAGSATPAADDDAAQVEPAAFSLPSGNIACKMTTDGVTCTIASAVFALEGAETCAATEENVFVVDADGASTPCAEERAADPDATELPYGRSTSVGDYTCTSATDGVTCVDGAGTGFRLSRSAYTALP
ncbi:hypothetical protein ACGIF2_05265 [Cellulomonas sp. P22]|uniref:hypothetical protein n=1 Tax=Cellulomonas sp. P22 TaxID=3373189 RepID=UPI00379F544E